MSFSFNGKQYNHRWFLTGVVGESASNYWHSVNEILDPRPIEVICSILATHYAEPEIAIKLLKKADVTHLGHDIKSSKFTGEWRQYSRQPEAYTCERFDVHNLEEREFVTQKIQFIEFTGRSWRADLIDHSAFVKKSNSQLSFNLGVA